MSSIENNRGRIRKPIAPEVVKYINDPVAKSDYETSYFTYLTINRAHVLMLEKQGIISKDVCQKILKATREIEANPVAPDFTKDSGIEDLYTTLERRLIKMVGLDVGGQQHTARSRNDLGATVVRMDTRDYYLKICELFNKFRATAIAVARDNVDAVMSGYTHMQPSEPVTFGHWLSAVLNGLERDFHRFAAAWDSMNICPLGGCSMGSTSFPIDRQMTSDLLGFNRPMSNSMDTTASRDYALEITTTLAMAADTLSRFAFDLYIWATPQYGYIEVDDSVAVCSSIMPQKKNAFTLEHIKAKAGHMQGYAMAMYSCMKNIIYSHSKDTSVEAVKHLRLAMQEMESDFVLAELTLRTLTVKRDIMLKDARRNFCTVTELANYLVRHDKISFREAHEIIATMVGNLCDRQLTGLDINRTAINEVMQKEFGKETSLTEELIQEALDPMRIAQAKKCLGGTAREEVTRQLDALEKQLEADEALTADRVAGLAAAKARLDAATNSMITA